MVWALVWGMMWVLVQGVGLGSDVVWWCGCEEQGTDHGWHMGYHRWAAGLLGSSGRNLSSVLCMFASSPWPTPSAAHLHIPSQCVRQPSSPRTPRPRTPVFPISAPSPLPNPPALRPSSITPHLPHPPSSLCSSACATFPNPPPLGTHHPALNPGPASPSPKPRPPLPHPAAAACRPAQPHYPAAAPAPRPATARPPDPPPAAAPSAQARSLGCD